MWASRVRSATWTAITSSPGLDLARIGVRILERDNTTVTRPTSHQGGQCPASGNDYSFQMRSGFDFAADFGFFVNGVVFGRTLVDEDADGTRDADELRFGSAEILLDLCSDGTIDHRQFTEGDGFYLFSDVPPGNHTVSQVLLAGEVQTLPASPDGYQITVNQSGACLANYGFGVSSGASLVVNSSDEHRDQDPGDGKCETGTTTAEGQPECTLWAAIQEANARAERQRILFRPAITAIHVAEWNPLPEITDPVAIDGNAAQVSLLGNPNAFSAVDRLRISTGDSSIRGLVMAEFSGNGIAVTTNGNNVIEHNVIVSNGRHGIAVSDSTENRIRGNRVGVDLQDGRRGNGLAGVSIGPNASSNYIGGVGPSEGNTIAYNGSLSSGDKSLGHGVVILGFRQPGPGKRDL